MYIYIIYIILIQHALSVFTTVVLWKLMHLDTWSVFSLKNGVRIHIVGLSVEGGSTAFH